MAKARRYAIITVDESTNTYNVTDMPAHKVARYLLHGKSQVATDLPYYLALKVSRALNTPGLEPHIVAEG